MTQHLDGGCYVTEPDSLSYQASGMFRWARVIGRTEGAKKISQFFAIQGPGTSPVLGAGRGELVIYVLSGTCSIRISGRLFNAQSRSGLHVRSGEACRLDNPGPDQCTLLITCCPGMENLPLLDEMPLAFDDAHPNRLVHAHKSKKEATGDRYYQLLVGPKTGSEQVTQFIGMIPKSKAPEHFHLYEEAICILSGSGRMWAGDSHAPLGSGSIVFLPRKQPHCLECEDEDGMELVGVFYPAGSPTVNYETSE